MNDVVTIDGPSGAGKTSTAQLVARRLNLTYLPSGRLFRAAAYIFIQEHISVDDIKQVDELLDIHNLELKQDGRTFYGGQDISNKLYDPTIGSRSTIIAQNKHLRLRLLELQRRIGEKKGCVIEGRSTAIEIFPQATTKIWLTADEGTRLNRKEQAEGKTQAGAVLTRDEIDKERRLAPMQKATDAITIDTTNLSLQQVADLIVQAYNQRRTVPASE